MFTIFMLLQKGAMNNFSGIFKYSDRFSIPLFLFKIYFLSEIHATNVKFIIIPMMVLILVENFVIGNQSTIIVIALHWSKIYLNTGVYLELKTTVLEFY